jgi:hypothetical protein
MKEDARVLNLSAFVSPAWCQDLIGAFSSTLPSSCYGVRRLPFRTEIDARLLSTIGQSQLTNGLREVRRRTRDLLHEFYIPCGELFVDYTLLTEMRIGDAHPAHADSESPSPDGGWIPNHTPWRHSVGMLYLNTNGLDYKGGELLFPTLGLRILPEAAQLVGFTSGRQHWHEVTPVTNGVRYSLSMWMTEDPAHQEAWS